MKTLKKIESSQINGMQSWFQNMNFVVKVPSIWGYLLMGGQILFFIVLILSIPFFFLVAPILQLLNGATSAPNPKQGLVGLILLVTYIVMYKRFIRPIIKSFRKIRRYARDPRKAFLDSRRPILLLRSFLSDSEDNLERIDQRTSEEFLVETLGVVGPVITVGHPGEEGLPVLGATRIYLDDDWQQNVLELCKVSNVVVIDAGNTEGVIWEMRNVKNYINPRRVLISFLLQQEVPDHHRSGTKTSFELFYRRFAGSFNKAFEISLPDYDPKIFLIQFDDNWKPYPIKFVPKTRGLRNPTTYVPISTLRRELSSFFSNLEGLNKQIGNQVSK